VNEIAQFTQRVQIELDGETLIEERRRFDLETGKVRVGREALADPAAKFTGAIGAVRRLTAEPSMSSEQRAGGFVRLRVAFPDRAPTPREPLLAVGSVADGIVIFVHYLDDAGRIAFGSGALGERNTESAPMLVDPKKVHELVARWTPTGEPKRRRLQLRLDHTIVWSAEIAWPQREGTVVAGRNTVDEPNCAPLFTGQLHSVQRSADGSDPLIGAGDTLRLRVQLPRARTGARDPLLITGRYAAGQLLMIEYLDAQTVRFSLDLWGSPLQASAPIPIDYARPHEIDVSLSALVAPPDILLERHVRRGYVRVAVDGREIWRDDTEMFTADAFEFAIGRNAIGGTGCGPVFTGEVLSAERISRE
jgi:hypothetical protein